MQSGATYLSVLRDEEKYFMRRLAQTKDHKRNKYMAETGAQRHRK